MNDPLCWLAIQGRSAEAALDALQMQRTGARVSEPGFALAGATIADGWFLLVFTEEPRHRLLAANLAAMSAGGRVVVSVSNDTAMGAMACEWRDGKEIWQLVHDGSDMATPLAKKGQMPPALAALEASAASLQAASARDVDHFYGVADQLATMVTGIDAWVAVEAGLDELRTTGEPASTRPAFTLAMNPAAVTARARPRPWWRFW